MSKITQYLNGHLLGEVTNNESIRQRFSRDGSVLSILPEIVVSPRTTNDIRKVARFSWQLAEKGHVLPITVRGSGSDKTGAAIGKGIIINTVAHLNNIIYLTLKGRDQFAHVQPGVVFGILNKTLESHGAIVPAYPASQSFGTVGGAVANNISGPLSGNYGKTGDWVNRLEVVLANGDLIETTRINRHELNKKKGLQTFEGELYRKIDGIIEDNKEIIFDSINDLAQDNTGYSGIAKVKERDGSFDLTPLFVGSQGTLGIISEIVLKTDFYASEESVIVASFKDKMSAIQAANTIEQLQPASLELISGELFKSAQEHGKKYVFSDKISVDELEYVLFIRFNDFNNGARKRKTKKTLKKLSKIETYICTSENYSVDELYAVKDVSSVILQPEKNNESLPSLIDGSSIPTERREEFIEAVSNLAKKHHTNLPITIDWLSGIVCSRPTLDLSQVSDKQKVFKLISDYMESVKTYGGTMSAESGEGRLRAAATHAQLSEDILDIYTQIRQAFDPFGTLNPGVKQKSDLKTLVSQLNEDYNQADFSQYSPTN